MSALSPSEFFSALLAKLSREAQKCDIGLYVKECGGAFVNNFREGKTLTIKQRLKWLNKKMNEKRVGRWESVTLAGMFPKDAAIINTEARK